MKKETKPLHASLFASGSGIASGCFYDETGKPTLVEGGVRIVNRSDQWYIKSSLQLSDGRMIENVYQVEGSGKDAANWTSHSSLLNDCLGRFQVLGDLILSTSTSEDRRFCGHEILRQLSESHYSTLGELFFNSQRHSSWSLELHKDHGADTAYLCQ